ncbi:MAG: DUF3568 family protein [Candidatus Omnitrophica bacterium]|nr:DUF3568 family protein [Candidatus Omnitrophota bacterium]
MRRAYLNLALLLSMSVALAGCAPVIVAGAAVGGYAVGKDSIQGEISASYESLWQASVAIATHYADDGKLIEEDRDHGRIEAKMGSANLRIYLEELTEGTIKLKVKSRRYLLPYMELSERVFVKILNRLK